MYYKKEDLNNLHLINLLRRVDVFACAVRFFRNILNMNVDTNSMSHGLNLIWIDVRYQILTLFCYNGKYHF